MSEEKKLTDKKIVNALEYCGSNHKDNSCEICPLRHVENCYDTVLHDNALDLIHRLQAENERLKINLANEKKWGKIQAKQTEKETAREILAELDLFFKGTTFRKGYEFKKIEEKLKEMAKSHGLEMDYEN